MPEGSDQISMEWIVFVVLYEDLLYISIKDSSGGRQIK